MRPRAACAVCAFGLTPCHALASVKSDAELAALKDEKDEEKTKELAFVVPRMLKTLVGAGHIDFSTGQQQDAADYLLHFLDKINL